MLQSRYLRQKKLSLFLTFRFVLLKSQQLAESETHTVLLRFDFMLATGIDCKS